MNLFTFPFYSALNQQSRFLGCGQVPKALPAPQNRWLPFVLRLPVLGLGLDCVRIFRAQDNSRYKTVPSSAFAYDAFTDGQQDYIFYYGGIVAGLNMPCDEYYLEANGYYSEVFTVVSNLDALLRLEWKSSGGIYQTGLSNLLYLDAAIAEPSYKIDEEGEEDADGNFVALRTRVEKTLKLDTALLPEFLVDALAGIALHESKQIGRYQDVNTLKVAPTWNKKGCAATVELTFLDGAAAVNEGCGTDAAFMPIDLTGFVPADCDGTGATWEAEPGTERCEQKGGKNTGWLEIRQIDSNQLSGTYNQHRWVRLRQDTTACPLPQALLRSRKIEDQVYRTNCAPNEVAGFVTYTVPEGQFTGTDQALIDQQALDYFNANKEAFANANATCTAPTYSERVGINAVPGESSNSLDISAFRTDAANFDVSISFEAIFTTLGSSLDYAGDQITILAGERYASKTIPTGSPVSHVNSSRIDSVNPGGIYQY